MIEETLIRTVIEGFPSFGGLALLAYVLLRIVRSDQEREREREQWYMSILDKVIANNTRPPNGERSQDVKQETD